MFHQRLSWLLAFAAIPLTATACEPQAYIPYPLPLFQPSAALPESAYDKFDDTGSSAASVRFLVTIGPEGAVTGAEALSGPEFLRGAASDTVRRYKYRPVIRNGQPVCALASATVVFATPGMLLAPQDVAGER